MKQARKSKRRKFNRSDKLVPNNKRVFTIVVEGAKTEKLYFEAFKRMNLDSYVNVMNHSHRSAPPQLLKHMKRRLKKIELGRLDEAWIVLDKDDRSDDEFSELFRWATKSEKYHIAVSNPSFEFWLVLHFEKGDGVRTYRDCCSRLAIHLNEEYDKSIDMRKFPLERIFTAIDNAERRDTTSSQNPLVTSAQTTVYKLVKKILWNHFPQ